MDTSSILGYKPTDPTQNLSGMLNIVNSMQQNQRGDMALQNEAINLNERKAAIPFLQSGSFLNDDGTLDTAKLTTGLTKIAPTTGMKMAQEYAAAHTQATAANAALNGLTSDLRGRIGSALSALPSDAPPELVGKTLDALGAQYKGAAPLVAAIKQGYTAHAKQDPAAGSAFLQQTARGVLPQETQQTMNSPSMSFVSTDKGTQPFNTKVGVPGYPVGPVGDPMAPPNQVTTTPTGQMGTTNPANGNFNPITAAPAAPPVNYPAGENKETWTDLQGQRTAAQAAANTAPVLHDINRQIVAEASKPGGPSTGAWGSLVRSMKSRIPGMNDTEGATDYDILGKMLERSALTAAQGMGPHTNAGLEASVRANGSLNYTPDALKKIAYLNDAIVHGSELYRNGLENAIKTDPNGVFAKRNFDQQWTAVATPQVLRLKNAVDNGSKEEIDAITKEVGGKGSDGAQALHKKLMQLLTLSGQ